MANWSGTFSITAGTTGTLTSADSTHADNIGATWPTGAQSLSNFYIRLLTGPGSPATVPIISNTTTQITIGSWPSGTPNNTTTYEIVLILNDQDHIIASLTLSTNVISELQDNATILVDGLYTISLTTNSVIRWNKSELTIVTFAANNRIVQGKAGFWSYIQSALAKTTPAPLVSYLRILDASHLFLAVPSAGIGNASTIHHLWGEDILSSMCYMSGSVGLSTNMTLSNIFCRQSSGATCVPIPQLKFLKIHGQNNVVQEVQRFPVSYHPI
jgi:hypothetical protein